MSPRTRMVFALFAFLPSIGVLSLAVYLVVALNGSPLEDPETWFRGGRIAVPILYAGGGVVGIALLQMALGAFLFVHCWGRTDLSPGERVGWPLSCLLVGSIALPIFFFAKSKLPGVTQGAPFGRFR